MAPLDHKLAKNGQKFNFLKNFHATNTCDQRDYL